MPSSAAPSSFPTDPAGEHALVWDDRPAADELAALDAACFEPALSAAVYRDWLKYPYLRCWVLRAEGSPQPLAWAVCQRIGDEGEVLRLGVPPAQRGKGWGRVLLLGVLARLVAEGAKRVYLEVRAGNAAALALYRGAGLRITGRRQAYYTNPPDDAVLMTWEPG